MSDFRLGDTHLLYFTAYRSVLSYQTTTQFGDEKNTADSINIHVPYYQQLQYKGVQSQIKAVKLHKTTIRLIYK